MKTFSTSIEIEGVKFELNFSYQPEEAPVMYYSDMSGHPGSAAEAHDITVTWVREFRANKLTTTERTDVTELLFEMGHEDFIIEHCIKHAEENEEEPND